MSANINLFGPSEYEIRKERRRQAQAGLFGVKSEPCGACSGSGRYDDTGSPPCGCCGGTGKVRRARPEAVQPHTQTVKSRRTM